MTMNKSLLLVLALSVSQALVGCGGSTVDEPNASPPEAFTTGEGENAELDLDAVKQGLSCTNYSTRYVPVKGCCNLYSASAGYYYRGQVHRRQQCVYNAWYWLNTYKCTSYCT